jgi:hypothetical protein
MGALRIFHEWAFRTEFKSLLWMTAVHSCIVFVLFALSFGDLRPNVLSANDDAKCVGAIVVGGLVAVFIIPVWICSDHERSGIHHVKRGHVHLHRRIGAGGQMRSSTRRNHQCGC